MNKMMIAGGAAIAALAAASAMAAGGAADTPYASKAIVSGNLTEAEQALQPVSYADAKDPARLINLATVYVQTHRFDRARAALEEVRRLPDETLQLSGQASYSSHAIARAMMGRLP